jgi:hypothetical protein
VFWQNEAKLFNIINGDWGHSLDDGMVQQLAGYVSKRPRLPPLIARKPQARGANPRAGDELRGTPIARAHDLGLSEPIPLIRHVFE